MEKYIKILLSAAVSAVALFMIAGGLIWHEAPASGKQQTGIKYGTGTVLPETLQEAEPGETRTDISENRTEEQADTDDSGEDEDRIQNDTSAGQWMMSNAVEQNGYLFYYNWSDDSIIRMDLSSGEQKTLIAPDEERQPCSAILATEQYLYVAINYPALIVIEQYTFDGERIGRLVKSGASWAIYEEGYLYYSVGSTKDKNLYRVRTEAGSEPELINDYVEDGIFQIHGEKIYYVGEGTKFSRMEKDGSGQEILDSDGGYYANWNFEYGDFNDGCLYYTDTPEYQYYKWDMKTGMKEPVSLHTPDLGYTAAGGFFIGDTMIHYIYDNQNGIWGYDPKTGEDRCIVAESAEEGRNEEVKLLQIPGATRVYYTLSVYDNVNIKWDDYLCAVDLDGTDPVSYGDIFIIGVTDN